MAGFLVKHITAALKWVGMFPYILNIL